MKKRKFGLAAIMLALLLCLACVFAACDDDPVTPTPPPEETEEEETVVEQVPVTVTPVDPPAGAARVTFARGAVQSAPEADGSYGVTVSTDLPGDGTLVLTAAQGENAGIGISAADDTDKAANTVTLAFTAASQPTFSATVTGVEVGKFSVSAVYTAAIDGATAGPASVSELDIRHTLDVTPAASSQPVGVKEAVTLTADASLSGATIAWATSGDEIGTLSATSGASVNLTPDGATKGTATVTASYSYTPYGETEEVTVSDTATVTINERAQAPVEEGLIAFADFDYDKGTDVYLQTGTNTNVTATYSANTTQSGTVHNGKAFAVTTSGDQYIDMTFDGRSLLSDSDTLTIAFWYNLAAKGGDWSSVATTQGETETSVRFDNLNVGGQQSGNFYPTHTEVTTAGGGVQNGASVTAAVDVANTWCYYTVTLDKTNGVYIYVNGSKICYYPYSIDGVQTVVDTFFSTINDTGTVRFFGYNVGGGTHYIDDLLICKGITGDNGVAALYAAVSGTAEA